MSHFSRDFQGIAFNLIIIRADQNKGIESTLVSERSRFTKRSIRFRLPTQTATYSSTTEAGDSTVDDIERNRRDRAFSMVSFKDEGPASPPPDQEGLAVAARSKLRSLTF